MPKCKTEIDGALYFAADDGLHCNQLYRLPLEESASRSGDAVDFADFLALSQNFGRTDEVVFADGYFDAYGKIDFSDVLILSAAFATRRMLINITH